VLLRTWKLEDVVDKLANQGYTDIAALGEELSLADVAKLAVGLAIQNRLRKLLKHLHAGRKEWEEQDQQKNANVKQVLQKMRAEPTSAQAQRDGCAELVGLFDIADTKTAFGTVIAAEGGIPVVLATMRAHNGDMGLLVIGYMLVPLVALDDDNEIAIVTARGTPIVLAVMTARIRQVDVQLHGCVALMTLAFNDNNKTAIAATGGIPLVLALMKAYLGDVEVQEFGCYALRNLAANVYNQTAIAAAGGIAVMLAGMRPHARNANVQEHRCCVLGHIWWSDLMLQM